MFTEGERRRPRTTAVAQPRRPEARSAQLKERRRVAFSSRGKREDAGPSAATGNRVQRRALTSLGSASPNLCGATRPRPGRAEPHAPVSRGAEKDGGSEKWLFAGRVVLHSWSLGQRPCSSLWARKGLWRYPRYRSKLEVGLKQSCWATLFRALPPSDLPSPQPVHGSGLVPEASLAVAQPARLPSTHAAQVSRCPRPADVDL